MRIKFKEGKLKIQYPRGRVAIAMLVFVLALSACGQNAATVPDLNPNSSVPAAVTVPTGAPTSAPTQTPAPTQPPMPTAAPTSSNPLDVFAKAQAALLSAKTVRLTIVSTDKGKTDTVVMESVASQAYRVKTADGESIAIKGKGMYNNENGKWTLVVADTPALDKAIGAMNPASAIDKLRQQMSEKIKPAIGADIVGGKPMVVYDYTAQGGTIKFWYGVTDGWLYKFAGNRATSGQGVGTVEYNIPLTIAAPIP